MARTPDRFPGERYDEGIVLYDRGAAGDGAGPPPAPGGMRYVDGAFAFRDALGVFDPRSGLPAPSAPGQVLYSVDGATFSSETPLTSPGGGWLVNDEGLLLVVG